jgi:hypothetical protein
MTATPPAKWLKKAILGTAIILVVVWMVLLLRSLVPLL